MAALRLVRKWGVPMATAASIPILAPVVMADSDKKEGPQATTRMIKPSELPIYEDPEEVLDFEYEGKERTSLEENVGAVRKEIQTVLDATQSVRERALQIYETSKAHSMATMDYITDEENILPRAGAITIGGLAGLIIGARKKGGFFKKVLYTSTGVVATASLCYPRQAYQLSHQVYKDAKDYATISYNFVAGVKPQSKISTPGDTPKEVPVTFAEETVLTPTPIPGPEGVESGASVKQEGKDVIVQLTPPPPPVEKDYGQSNPEDSDMYTTRS